MSLAHASGYQLVIDFLNSDFAQGHFSDTQLVCSDAKDFFHRSVIQTTICIAE